MPSVSVKFEISSPGLLTVVTDLISRDIKPTKSNVKKEYRDLCLMYGYPRVAPYNHEDHDLDSDNWFPKYAYAREALVWMGKNYSFSQSALLDECGIPWSIATAAPTGAIES